MPQHAYTSRALSFRGAQRLTEEFWQHISGFQFDISLKCLKWVCGNYAHELQASFVMPAISQYSTHDSGIL